MSSYELFSATEILERIVLERMLSGLNTCRYGVGLEPIVAAVTESATATSRSTTHDRDRASSPHPSPAFRTDSTLSSPKLLARSHVHAVVFEPVRR